MSEVNLFCAVIFMKFIKLIEINVNLMKKIILLLIFLFVGFGAFAKQMNNAPISSRLHPSEYCDIAKEFGYPSRGYKVHFGGCISEMIAVTPTSGRNGLKNSLYYQVVGILNDPAVLSYISFKLYLNNDKEGSAALEEFNRVVRGIGNKIFGRIPDEISSSIIRRKNKKWTIIDWDVEVKSQVWATGLGSDVSLILRPK